MMTIALLRRSRVTPDISFVAAACSPSRSSLPPSFLRRFPRPPRRDDDKAADIVDTAPAGEPLEVVVTSRGADGAPVISTVLAKTKSKARDIVANALGRSKTIGAEMNHRVSIDAYNDTYRSQQWALTALKAETVHQETRGSGVTVAVIDTGVKSSHSDLSDSVLSGTDYVSPGTSANDENGHGTHVAGIIAARAQQQPRHRRHGTEGQDPPGAGPRQERQRHQPPTSPRASSTPPTVARRSSTCRSAAASRARRCSRQSPYAISKNVLVVAAAGNRGCGLLGSPDRVSGGLPGRGRRRRRHPVAPAARPSPAAARGSTSRHPATASSRR